MNLLNVSPLQLIELWEQLMRCVHGTNTYAGNVAEIYITSIIGHDNIVAHNPESKFARQTLWNANETLYQLCSLFEKRNGVKLWVFNGDEALPLDYLRPSSDDDFYSVRVHIGVKDKE